MECFRDTFTGFVLLECRVHGRIVVVCRLVDYWNDGKSNYKKTVAVQTELSCYFFSTFNNQAKFTDSFILFEREK